MQGFELLDGIRNYLKTSRLLKALNETWLMISWALNFKCKLNKNTKIEHLETIDSVFII